MDKHIWSTLPVCRSAKWFQPLFLGHFQVMRERKKWMDDREFTHSGTVHPGSWESLVVTQGNSELWKTVSHQWHYCGAESAKPRPAALGLGLRPRVTHTLTLMLILTSPSHSAGDLWVSAPLPESPTPGKSPTPIEEEYGFQRLGCEWRQVSLYPTGYSGYSIWSAKTTRLQTGALAWEPTNMSRILCVLVVCT